VVVVVVDDGGVEVWEFAGVEDGVLLDDEEEEELDWFASSSTSFASSAATEDCADETDSLRAVVTSVPRVCPAVTC
jgi:hypothetical protein